MKKRIAFFTGLTIIAMNVAVAAFPMGTCAAGHVRHTRTTCGFYKNYMQIETDDGNIWQLSDKDAKNNPYMKQVIIRVKGKRKKIFVPKFREYQRVKVTFDTRGTKGVKDDRIIKVIPVKNIKGTVVSGKVEVLK